MSDENTPDFDNMSPEELMAWMETLAERQGATEGFTTEKRVDIAEVDPDTVEDTGPGYIPYGMSEEEWAKRLEKEEAEKAERLAQRAAQQNQPPPAETLDQPDDEAIAPAAALDQFTLPDLDNLDLSDSGPTEVDEPAAAGLDWLENLAAEQTGSFPEMDLSGLGDELANMDLGGLEEDVSGAADPMSWLEDMAAEQGVGESPSQPATPPPAMDAGAADDDVDPIEWLESLAAQSDNPPSNDEFMTEAGLDIAPPADMDETQAPGYQDFQFEMPDAADSVGLPDLDSLDVSDSSDPDDPVAWLDSLAASQGSAPADATPTDPAADSEVSSDDKDMLTKLDKGISDPAEMENWMSALLEKGAQRDDVPDYIEEEEDAAIEAQIPDWLLDQVGTPPDFLNDEEAAPASAPTPAAEEFVDLPAGLEGIGDSVDDADIPDWLQEDVVDEAVIAENIFATSDDTTLDDLTDDSGMIDTSDPWVEAFEEERTQEGVPGWYMEKLAETTGEGNPVLEAADFSPDPELDHGQPEPVPDWLADGGSAAASTPVFIDDVEPATPADTSWLEGLTEESEDITEEEIPDWLKEQVTGEQEAVVDSGPSGQSWLEDADIDAVETIPDWLLDTISEGEEPEAISTDAVIEAPASQPVPAAPPPAPATPAPAPAADVSQALTSARGKLQNNDVEGALADYESVVRANAGLDDVINDLSAAIKGPHKNAAPIYRVLGDGLMRKGRLQDALDTYRKALNLL